MKKNHTIYLVDSDASARKGLKRLLAAVGYGVEAFASYEKFLKIQTIDSKACLILDAQTSALSTMDLRTEFIEKKADIPVVFISAGDDKESREYAFAVKAVGFFLKPVDGPALLDAIAWALETHGRDTT